MHKVLIIEDEEKAILRLQKLIAEILPDTIFVASLKSIEESVKWLQNNPQPDLIFVDIQLSDGPSFDIFKQVQTSCPLIFTTAFDSFAIKAFKLNSIDYLLKPIKKEELRLAIEKFQHFFSKGKENNAVNMEMLLQSLKEPQQFKQRFVIKLGDHMHSIETTQIAYFYTENKANYIVTKSGKKFPSDYNLDQLETVMNPKDFFRINRQFLIGFQSIAEMFTYSKARVLIKLNPPSKLETIVSTERAASFKLWLAGD
jgi:DNA-binding LytR/AlgR family response regulator